MRMNQNDIIDEILEHIRRTGGEFGEWCVGTAADSERLSFQQRQTDDPGDALIYREAYTTFAAAEIVERLAQGFGLHPAQTTASKPKPGKIVFVYRPHTAGLRNPNAGVHATR